MTAIGGWKIFRMNDDTDWYVAESEYQAKEAMAENMCQSVAALIKDGAMDAEPGELSDADIDRMVYVDDDDESKRSFRAQLQLMIDGKEKMPCLFASTNY